MKGFLSALQLGWQPTDLVTIPTAAGKQCPRQPRGPCIHVWWLLVNHTLQPGRPHWAQGP